jgi:hypothetical protein
MAHLLDNVFTPPLDGRVTNGGKGISYLSDHYVAAMLADLIRDESSPVAGN